ncbi:MAG: DUF424 family protein [Candidatus Altiarchaeota archaeon]|nr:DUF424 family protein [Candidatus Altiarchaeota archaeon]
MIWFKLYSEGKAVLAIADADLMGKNFEEGDLVLSIGSFYKGELVDETEIQTLLDGVNVINAVGKESTKILVKNGLAVEDAIKSVAGIPHLQVFVLND